MKKLPKKFIDRVSSKIKLYQEIVTSLRSRDVSEADTVTVIKDMLSDIFGYDKYLELTSEQQIRGTFCDLAIKIDGKIQYLIEVKSAGVALNNTHLRQAIGYGANQGIQWIILTNSIDWKFYRIEFGQPINYEEIAAFSLLDISVKKDDDLQKLLLLSREGVSLNAMQEYHQQYQILNKHVIGQLLISDTITAILRKEMRKLFPELSVEPQQIKDILYNEVIKRDVLEGDKLKESQSKIKKAQSRLEKKNKSEKADATDSVEPTSQKIEIDITKAA